MPLWRLRLLTTQPAPLAFGLAGLSFYPYSERAMIEKGVVQNWNDSGYGFIRPDAGGENVFVHATALRGASHLIVGERVEFEARTVERGRRADYARKVS